MLRRAAVVGALRVRQHAAAAPAAAAQQQTAGAVFYSTDTDAPSADDNQQSVQEAYNPTSHCFGCGPAAPKGVGLRSFRDGKGGLEAIIVIDPRYSAFPGIVSGGVLSTICDCQGNWTAAIALMDRSSLPQPPLTLTKSMLVSFKEPVPPGTELVVRSSVVEIREESSSSSSSRGSGGGAGGGGGHDWQHGHGGGGPRSAATGPHPSVEVDVHISTAATPQEGGGEDGGGGGGGVTAERVLVTATGIFKQLGAVRAL